MYIIVASVACNTSMYVVLLLYEGKYVRTGIVRASAVAGVDTLFFVLHPYRWRSMKAGVYQFLYKMTWVDTRVKNGSVEIEL